MMMPGRAAYSTTFTSSRVRSISILRDAGELDTWSFDELADLVVFDQQVGELLLRGVPAALPADHDAGAKADRIDFLTHRSSQLSVLQFSVHWLTDD